MQDEELGNMWVGYLLTVVSHMIKLGHQVAYPPVCWCWKPTMILSMHYNHQAEL